MKAPAKTLGRAPSKNVAATASKLVKPTQNKSLSRNFGMSSPRSTACHYQLAIWAFLQLSRTFRPELVGRFTDKIVFKPLSLDTQIEIAKLAVAQQLEIFRQKGFENLDVNPNAIEFLVRNGFHRTLGARPMKQVIAKYLGDAVASSVLANGKPSGTFDVMPNHSALVLA